MTNKERWLSGLALLLSLLPFILVAGSLQLLPERIEIPKLIQSEELPPVTVSKYGYLYLGLFGLIPGALIVIARLLHARGLVERNFMSMTVVVLVLAVVFLLVCVYGMVYQIIRYDIDLLKTFDFFGGSVVCASLLVGFLANYFPRLRKNDFIGLKNRYTLADNRVWAKVHYVAADVYMSVFYGFALFSSALSIWLDFRFGWVHIVLWVLAVFGLILWGRLYSRALGKALARETSEVGESVSENK